jgi:hypothetical protein
LRLEHSDHANRWVFVGGAPDDRQQDPVRPNLKEVRVGRCTQCPPALCTYLFTGSGRQHGDISADCVAKALGVPIDTNPRALAILHEWVKTTGAEMN